MRYLDNPIAALGALTARAHIQTPAAERVRPSPAGVVELRAGGGHSHDEQEAAFNARIAEYSADASNAPTGGTA